MRTPFAGDPANLPVVEQNFAFYERANLHLALTELLAEPQHQAELLGVIVLDNFWATSLARLARRASPCSACSRRAGCSP
jgi:hypothetical protein